MAQHAISQQKHVLKKKAKQKQCILKLFYSLHISIVVVVKNNVLSFEGKYRELWVDFSYIIFIPMYFHSFCNEVWFQSFKLYSNSTNLDTTSELLYSELIDCSPKSRIINKVWLIMALQWPFQIQIGLDESPNCM